MKIVTRLSPGDVAYVTSGNYGEGPIETRTIGQVRVTVTDTPGLDGMRNASNYSSQQDYVEEYMCVETGIGSGSIYTLGKHLFATEKEALAQVERNKAEHAKALAEREEWQRNAREQEICAAKRTLARHGIVV